MRTNYVLIDYENVQPEALAALDHEHFKVKVFVGANQAKVPTKMAAALQRMGDKAEYIQISGNGSNALDFHIAYYIGRLAAQESPAFFHIISKDQGFKPLIEHLKTQNIFAALWKDVSDIPLAKAVASKSPEERQAFVVDRLAAMKSPRPATLKTLAKTIERIFLEQLTADEIDAVIKRLQAKGVVTVTGKRLTYSLSA